MPSQNYYYQNQSNNRDEQLEYPEFFLKARDLYEIDEEKLEVLSPENPPQEPKRNLLMILTPVFLMLMLMIFVRNRMTSGGMMYILYFAASMVIGGAMSVWAYFDNGKDYKKKVAERKQKYDDYIERKIEKIEMCRSEERRIISKRNPSLEETVRNILEFSPNLFAKRKEHEDYLDVRIGTGTVKSLRQIEYKKQEYVHVYDDLMDIPEQIHDKYEYIKDMPVVLPLGKVNAVGFVGNRTMLYQIMKNVILTIAGQESFTEVKMVFLLDEIYAPFLHWVRWLPNTYDSETKERNIMYDDATSKIVLGNIYAEISRRESMKKEEIQALPDYIVFAFRSERLSEHPVSKYFDMARNYGFTFIFFEESESLLHKACAYAVTLDSEHRSGTVKDLSNATELQVFSYSRVKKEIAEDCARKLAPVFIKEPSLENNLTKSITLYQLLGIKNVRELSLANRWNSSKIYQSMAAPLGVKSGGEVVYLDIHEKFHGPHGLVAGTTGSGKSEILQSYILSMATLFHPYEVGFIIIDFKGGGMANQFKDLPHLNGAITNIDGKQINRSLMSIKAELIKRQELFAKYDVNRIDDYIKLYKNGTTPVPLPHLILIVDEFAELKSEQPEFMKELKMLNYKMIVGLGFARANIEYNDFANKRLLAILGRDDLGRADFVRYLLKKMGESAKDYPLELTVIDDENGSLSYCKDNPALTGYYMDKEDVSDIIEEIYELAIARKNKMMLDRNIDGEPLRVIVFGSSNAPDVISSNKEIAEKFWKVVRAEEYSELRIAVIFTAILNEPLTAMSNQALIMIKNCMNTLCFENIEDIKFIDISADIKKRVKEPNAVGDAFFITDRMVKRIKTVSK